MNEATPMPHYTDEHLGEGPKEFPIDKKTVAIIKDELGPMAKDVLHIMRQHGYSKGTAVRIVQDRKRKASGRDKASDGTMLPRERAMREARKGARKAD